ncbi:MAG TPA: polysaccharide deacetylase family protein [Natronosporangium sp.]|nr:polysaccharide deacetylase family protein [Natronosporangium sp.]
MWFSGWRRWAVLATAAVTAAGGGLLAGSYLGRPGPTEPPTAKDTWQAELIRRPADLPPGVLAPPPAAAGQTDEASASQEDEAREDEAQADEAAATEVVTQPIIGVGQPPLQMPGTGPFGTHRDTGADYLALTFDDGPDPRYTPAVLDLLKEHGVTATFCMVGEMAAAYPELVRRIADEGHTLCNHSWDHDFGLGSRSREEIRADLVRTNTAIQAAVPGARISYYRQPGGAWTPKVVEVAAELGMSSLHWSVDPFDWQQPAAEVIAQIVESEVAPGGIVLLHDGGGERSQTVRAVRQLLPTLAERMSVAAMPPWVGPPRLHGRELPVKPGQL